MKKIYLLFVALFSVNLLFSQILYKEGIVKGKNATYEVARGKGECKVFTFIRNVNNPDSSFRHEPARNIIPPQLTDIEMQVTEIVRDCLSPEEIAKMDPSCSLMVLLRLDAETRKLLQISHFYFLHNDPFWANFPPDRFRELEQAILKKLELPAKLQETYFEIEFCLYVFPRNIQDIKQTRRRRRSAIKEWKRNDFKVKVIPGQFWVVLK